MTQAAVLAQAGNSNGTFRNKIINGAMVIDQRNAGSSVNATQASYTLDRWVPYCANNSKFTIQRVLDAPAGFSNSVKLTSSAATSISSGDSQYYDFRQRIEGYNIVDLAWGTSSAKPVTVSFWVKSSLTGLFGGAVVNGGHDRSCAFSYNINSANTWEYKTVIIPGDTAGGGSGWAYDNGTGAQLIFCLGSNSYNGTAGTWGSTTYNNVAGAVALVSTNAATLQLTGVQFEIGTTPTTYELRSYSKELMMCQRYFENNYGSGYAVGSAASYPYNQGTFFQGFNTSSGQKHIMSFFRVTKRASPSVNFYDNAGTAGVMSSLDAGGTPTNGVAIGYTPINTTSCACGAGGVSWYGAAMFYTASAEL
jgi:hypothetical protein